MTDAPDLIDDILGALDVWYLRDSAGWIGAVDVPPGGLEPPGTTREGASPRRVDLAEHPFDRYRIQYGVTEWFRYPGDREGLARWIAGRHRNRVWLTATVHPKREGLPRYRSWAPRGGGRNSRFFLPVPSGNGHRAGTEDIERLVVYRPTGEVPQAPRWLWPGRIPMRMVTMFDGDPDQGKSTLTLDIAARVTRGWGYPDGTVGDASGDVVIMSAEDDPSQTIEPRLMAAGANLGRIHIVSGLRDIDGSLMPPAVPSDLAVLQDLIRNVGAALVIVDPFIAFLDSTIDSYKDAQVRRAMSALKLLAEEEDTAVVLVRHLKKDSGGGKAIYGGGGSIGFIAHARAAMLAGSHPDDRNLRVLTQSKLNVGVKGPSLTYSLVPWETNGAWARVEWGASVEVTADELLSTKVKESPKRESAEDWLLTVLIAGPTPSERLESMASEQDFANVTYRRARAALQEAGVIDKRKVGSPNPHWEWFLVGEESL